MKCKNKGLRHIWDACRYSLNGFRAAFRDEAAFRQICFYVLPLAIFAFLFAESWQIRTLLLLPLVLALIVELVNTAIESVVDLASPQWQPLAKKAKDTASAAQFCAQIFVALVWGGYIMAKL